MNKTNQIDHLNKPDYRREKLACTRSSKIWASRSRSSGLIEVIFAPNLGERTWMTCKPQVNVLPWSSSIMSWSSSPLFTNKRLSIRTPVSLTSRTLHGAESAPRCRRPARLTSIRDPFRLNPIESGLLFSAS